MFRSGLLENDNNSNTNNNNTNNNTTTNNNNNSYNNNNKNNSNNINMVVFFARRTAASSTAAGLVLLLMLSSQLAIAAPTTATTTTTTTTTISTTTTATTTTTTTAAVPLQVPPTCSALEPLGIFEQIKQDLSRYQDLDPQIRGLLSGFCAMRRKACITFRVVDGIPYVLDLFPGYQSRHRATLHGIYRALLRLGSVPDVEVVIDVTDGELQKIDLPVLVITHKRSLPAGILYPDFTFYSWPESSCPPLETSHAYSHLFDLMTRNWTHKVSPWLDRSDTIFWRGAPVDDHGARSVALQYLADVPGADARFMSWRAVSITGQNEVPGCVGLLEQCRHRYLAFLAGTTYSSRIKYQLLCGSVVLAAEPEFVEWWTQLLLPGVHFAPVMPDWSNAEPLMEMLRQQPSQAEAIAQRGQQLALKALSPTAVDCYWWKLLSAASTVLPPALDPLPTHARPLEDVLLWPDDVSLSAIHGVSGGAPPPVLRPFRETQDASCFAEESIRRWELCCDTNQFGPIGNEECWLSLAVEEQLQAADLEEIFRILLARFRARTLHIDGMVCARVLAKCLGPERTKSTQRGHYEFTKSIQRAGASKLPLVRLSLNGCGISAIGAQALAEGLGEANVEVVELMNNIIDDEGGEALLAALQRNKRWKQLQVSFNQISDPLQSRIEQVLRLR
ncbi:unnamed protein product [Polarella glacialis]|uniref:Glycosyl transferase CAP10 domain-containing protein n=1 Tax=Polarella glacialis TaxID=89957 RepID=A0A813KD00_POLGL|nr:unnamed protein product [Polarella glacialis]